MTKKKLVLNKTTVRKLLKADLRNIVAGLDQKERGGGKDTGIIFISIDVCG